MFDRHTRCKKNIRILFRSKRLLMHLLVALLLSIGLLGCATSASTDTKSDQFIRVFVSIEPQAYFAEKIGGEHVKVSVLIPPGADPHTYEPTPQQMKELSEADLYVKVGTMEFEDQWMDRIQAVNRNMVVVDTSESIEIKDGDPHIWLSPRLVNIQADHIYQGLAQVDAAHQDNYSANLQAFQEEIERLDRDILTILGDVQHKEFLVFHPSWGYFCRDYGLTEIAIEDEGKEPTAQEMARLIDQARQKGIQVIVVSPEHSSHQAEAIARDLGGHTLTLDPLARDYSNNLRKSVQQLAKALSGNSEEESK